MRSTRISCTSSPPPYDVVANLPYHITSPILHALLGAPPRPARLVLMVQREVAERIAAPPGKMSYLSVFVQYHARVRIAVRVPPAAFEPEPAVESAVIVVEPYEADDRLDPAAEDAALAPRPGRLPRAPQDDPQRPVAPAAGRRRRGSRQRSRPPASTPTGARRPSRWGSGSSCVRRSARSGRTGAAAWIRARGPAEPRNPRKPENRDDRTDPLRRLSPVVRLAPAKLNLTLAVIGRRDDGYHDLHSVFVPLALADRLSLAPVAGHAGHAPRDRSRRRPAGGQPRPPGDRRGTAGGRWRLARRPGSGPGPGRPAREADPGRRRARWRHRRTRPRPSTAPSRRGARSSTTSTRLPSPPRIGSDVPFFLAGGPALVEGRGERVTPLHGLHGAPGVLLVTPAVAVSTPDVFAAFDAIRRQRRRLRPDVVGPPGRGAAGRACPPPTWSPAQASWPSANDLLPATALVVPTLVPFRRALSRLLQRPIGLSGSGPTLWALYPSRGRGRRSRPTPSEPPFATAPSTRPATAHRSSRPRPSPASPKQEERS